MRYRRDFTEGATWFFTVNLQDRRSQLLTENIEALRASVRAVHAAHPFEIVAWVVLPEHLHAVWTLPVGDDAYSMRWNRIKGGFSRTLAQNESVSQSRVTRRERGIWQRRFWEHRIRDETDLQRHVDYIHFNPVKHGWVNRVVDWPYSSLHRHVRRGWVLPDWADGGDIEGQFGER